MKRNKLFGFLVFIVVTSLACGLFSGGQNGTEESLPSGGDNLPEDAPPPARSEEGDSAALDTEFPLPSDVKNLMELGPGAINYQTSLSLDEVVEFYRDAFADAGYDEREITTVINDTTFSIVWDGHPNGQAIVVQGVDLGDGTVNVNVRFEDV